MARVTIKLEKGECECDVRERLAKALADDELIVSTEKYNDSLMTDLVDKATDIYMKQYLLMMKDIVEVLKEELA